MKGHFLVICVCENSKLLGIHQVHLLYIQEELENVWPFFAKDAETFTCPEGEMILYLHHWIASKRILELKNHTYWKWTQNIYISQQDTILFSSRMDPKRVVLFPPSCRRPTDVAEIKRALSEVSSTVPRKIPHFRVVGHICIVDISPFHGQNYLSIIKFNSYPSTVMHQTA